jgi:hypothetical protein
MKAMKKLSKTMMIVNVLQNDANNAGAGLSVDEIAHSVFGNYHKETAKFHEKKISQLMGAVCELAAANNIIIYAVKKSPNKDTPEIKSRIVKWRVFVQGAIGCNEELIDALLSKKKNGEAHTKSFIRMLSSAKEYGVISGEALKNFEISLQ